jgi:ribonuclease PH
VVDAKALGERTLWVDCDVLQADGGTRTASITGAWTALALATWRLRRRGAIDREPLTDSIAGISVGLVDGFALLDLPYEEDARAAVDMNVIATGSGRLAEIQGTGEGTTFSRTELDTLTDLALRGIAQLSDIQREVLRGVGALE